MDVVTKKFLFTAQSDKEKFAEKVYKIIVDNFAETFFVGGMVRDLLLGREVTDVDITTSAAPDVVARLLADGGVECDMSAQQFGLVRAVWGDLSVEITTLRKDIYGDGRYPSVEFVTSAQVDSVRRDFTINALYLSQKDETILDFHHGLEDIEQKLIRFIGDPVQRIEEDPLRLVRAIRFALVLGFEIEQKTLMAVKSCFDLIEKISARLIERETEKIFDADLQKKFLEVLHNKKLLDTIQK